MTPSLLVIGGFLGAGKTTVSTNLVKYLWDMNREAAYVTNDQSSGLVDTEIAAAGGIAVKEIAGGCFCCRCDEFALALDEIAVLREADIIIAEAVGSCTDLVATVIEPLRQDLQRPYRTLPMTVVVDPIRAEAVLHGAATTHEPALHEDVTYIFLKQLEEAQVILVNKADSIAAEQLNNIVAATKERFPKAHVVGFSARNPGDVQNLWTYLECTESEHRPIQQIDYERYAKGEALLGWLNAEFRVEPLDQPITMDALSDVIGAEVHRRQVNRGVEIAHLKVSLRDDVCESKNGEPMQISVVQCVSSEATPVPVKRSSELLKHGRALINLRAQANPAILEEDVRASLEAAAQKWNLKVDIVRVDSFAPGAPNPPYQRR